MVDIKAKGLSTPKSKTPSSENRGRKNNALKDSKNINITTKTEKKEPVKSENNKKKGKENINSKSNFNNDEGCTYILLYF